MSRGGRWFVAFHAALVGVVTWIFVARTDENIPPIVFSVETEMRQYDVGLATDAGSRPLTVVEQQ